MPEPTVTSIHDEIKTMLKGVADKGATTTQGLEELKTWKDDLLKEGGKMSAIEKAVEQLEALTAKQDISLADALKQLNSGPDKEGEKGGFENFGQFAKAVHTSSFKGGTVDAQLKAWVNKAPNSAANEGTGADGGYLVPGEFVDRITQLAFSDDAILSMTNNIPTSKNSVTMPVSEVTPWGSTGVQANWLDEKTKLTESQPQIESRTMRLNKLGVLVPITEELLDDATAMETFINQGASQALTYKTGDAIMWGDGVGRPLGVFNSGALVTVAKETIGGSQTASTINMANIANMYSRMLPNSMVNANWFINPDCLTQLIGLTIGSQPVWAPGGSVVGAPYGTLLGRPIRPSVHAKTLGTVGDIALFDLKQYLSISKGIKVASSMHLWFDYDVTAFRFTFRVAGAPWLSKAVTPAQGSSTLSPFIALATRS